jgi:hypothetical protein
LTEARGAVNAVKDRKLRATAASRSEPKPSATVKVTSGLVSGETEILAATALRAGPQAITPADGILYGCLLSAVNESPEWVYSVE